MVGVCISLSIFLQYLTVCKVVLPLKSTNWLALFIYSAWFLFKICPVRIHSLNSEERIISNLEYYSGDKDQDKEDNPITSTAKPL
ncbi:hypothetical protein EB796_014750 [Bugula neritina]|uniref:Uncharacterized protein n=1 Tax=Bugula neritina TaxID=10212 RepID=A0A7J7JNE3_BUGNE|nr:hypothetical protein EB796_014750 [Bugula neritina]